MRFTPPVQIIYALKQAISEYFNEGEENRYKRYLENWRTLCAGMKSLGFRFALREKDESGILTSILEPSNSEYSFQVLHDELYNEGFTIYPGKTSQNNTFRIA